MHNLFGSPTNAKNPAKIMAGLAMWATRALDNLPTGPQNAKY